MVARETVKYRSFQKKFWNELLGITVKPYPPKAEGNTVGTSFFKKKEGAVETRYRDT